MNIKLGLTYIFKDEYWFKKITLPAICFLIPLIGQVVVAGWSVKLIKNIIDGVEEPLPDLVFIEDLKRGFFFMGIEILYIAPIYLFSYASTLLSTVLMQNSTLSMGVMSTISTLLGIFYNILLFFVAIMVQIAQITFITKNDFKAAFKLKEIWHLFINNPFDWVLVWLISLMLFIILGPLGMLACIIGVFFTMTYLTTVASHLSAQAYLRSVQKGQLSANLPE